MTTETATYRTTWVYRNFRDSGCFTVGFFSPSGEWEAESDHEYAHDAAERVMLLNGGGTCKAHKAHADLLAACKSVAAEVNMQLDADDLEGERAELSHDVVKQIFAAIAKAEGTGND